MYDHSRVPSYTNVSSYPHRMKYNHWPLDASTTGTAIISQSLSPTTATLSSISCVSQPQRTKTVLTHDYVNYNSPSSSLPPLPTPQPPPSLQSSSATAAAHLYTYKRPKSTIFRTSTPTNPAPFSSNDLRQRSESSKAIIGVVKPMVHQRSFTQLNNSESPVPKKNIDNSYNPNSTYSLCTLRSANASSTPYELSSAIYRSRPSSAYNNINNQPPVVPRRNSSINNSKYASSRRSSRTTSTTSSFENEQKQNLNRTMVDIKRLEMFYGSVGTLVKSARSIACLYTTSKRQLANCEDWSFQQRGVPLWIFNTGFNLKRERQIRLSMAHPESCFSMWSNTISDQAELHILQDNYITCWLPASNLLVILQFECNDACRLFLRNYYEILEHEHRMNLEHVSSCDEVIQQQPKQNGNNKEIPRRYSRLRTLSTKHEKHRQQQEDESDIRRCRSLSRVRIVKKSSISGPINFEHINHISNGCPYERPLSSTSTLRSLHASMSNLPTNGTLTDRCAKQNKAHISTLFEPRTTAV